MPESATPSGVPAGTRPALSAVDVLAVLCELFAFGTLAFWGFAAWPFPWNIVAGIVAPVVAILGGLHVNGVARLLMDESTPDADSPRTADGVWWQVPADLDTSMWL